MIVLTVKALTVGTKLVREDGKVFTVKEVAHWSDIVSADGDKDRVKWLGENSFIGNGVSYTFPEEGTP